MVIERPARVLLLVGPTLGQRRRSGVHRVVVETARAMAGVVDLDLVRWDAVEGGLRFLDAFELDQLFGGGDWPAGLQLRRQARRLGPSFWDFVPDPERTWLLAPEVAWHETNGTEIFARVLTQCRVHRVRTAAVFYDLIPIRNAVYGGGAALHEAYVAELARCDLLLSISRHSGDDLGALWSERGVEEQPKIAPVLLPDAGFGRRRAPTSADEGRQPTVVLLGTVEPRKRQVEFLEAMASARGRSPETARRRVLIFGSLHPYVADAFNAFLARNPWVEYRDYAKDDEVAGALADADFTAFVSDDEGYGLPIAESLASGAPCLCADFGSMAEIAEGGGCLTVDVRRTEALEAAVVQLCEDQALRRRLREEIARRPFRRWADYAADILERMAETPAPSPSAEVTVAAFAADAASFGKKVEADVLVLPDAEARDRLIAEATRRAWPALLPDRLPIGDAGRDQADLESERGLRAEIAAVERRFQAARRAVPAEVATRPVFLRVLISTYNRRPFVTANVRWLLDSVLSSDPNETDLVVVDGGSTDGTVKALKDIRDRRFRVVASPVNVGMLSGLREASRELGAEYVWIVGDDDFIRPESFRAVLDGLKANAGLPLGFVNFAVYHRAVLALHDRPELLIGESNPVALDVQPDGVVPVRSAAEQTDNLFTAIYAIIWRADVLAAAYDHRFDGEPFADLVEAVPCTDLILRRYADCDALWRAEPSIAGNAHNSWSRWRPRWHAVVMPEAFALARECGVDPVKLQRWADMHRALYEEALLIAEREKTDPGLDGARLARARVHFRRPELSA